MKLNPAVVNGGSVQGGLQVSADGNFVVYLADQETDEVDELYSVPIGGRTATKLNPTLVSGGDVLEELLISPDSSRVVYVADQETDGVNELYSVPIGGGAATKLNPTLVSGGDVLNNLATGFQLSADSQRVVYTVDQDTDTVDELYSVTTIAPPGIPTLPEWGMILLTLSLLAMATWQLAGVPTLATGGAGVMTRLDGTWIRSVLWGQVTATAGLGVYAMLVGPLVAHDGIGAFLAGMLIGVIIEGYRRSAVR